VARLSAALRDLPVPSMIRKYAGDFGFFTLIQLLQGPDLYAYGSRFEAMPCGDVTPPYRLPRPPVEQGNRPRTGLYVQQHIAETVEIECAEWVATVGYGPARWATAGCRSKRGLCNCHAAKVNAECGRPLRWGSSGRLPTPCEKSAIRHPSAPLRGRHNSQC
jgi:hypothetical protein